MVDSGVEDGWITQTAMTRAGMERNVVSSQPETRSSCPVPRAGVSQHMHQLAYVLVQGPGPFPMLICTMMELIQELIIPHPLP